MTEQLDNYYENIENRLSCYKYMLYVLKEREEPHNAANGFCQLLYLSTLKNHNILIGNDAIMLLLSTHSYNIINWLPELKEYKPISNRIKCGFWFSPGNYKIRIAILETIIEILEKKITC